MLELLRGEELTTPQLNALRTQTTPLNTQLEQLLDPTWDDLTEAQPIKPMLIKLLSNLLKINTLQREFLSRRTISPLFTATMSHYHDQPLTKNSLSDTQTHYHSPTPLLLRLVYTMLNWLASFFYSKPSTDATIAIDADEDSTDEYLDEWDAAALA